jgi:hypothetical protein
MNRNHTYKYRSILADAVYSVPAVDLTPETIGQPTHSLGQGPGFALRRFVRISDGEVVVCKLCGLDGHNSHLWNAAVERWYPKAEWRRDGSCWLPEVNPAAWLHGEQRWEA